MAIEIKAIVKLKKFSSFIVKNKKVEWKVSPVSGLVSSSLVFWVELQGMIHGELDGTE